MEKVPTPLWFHYKTAPVVRSGTGNRPRIILFGEEDFAAWKRQRTSRQLSKLVRYHVLPHIKAHAQLAYQLRFAPNDEFAVSKWIGQQHEDRLWVPRDPENPNLGRQHLELGDNVLSMIVKYDFYEGRPASLPTPYFMLFVKVVMLPPQLPGD